MSTTPEPLPSFFVPGVRKAGSSTLYQLLRQHPEICMSDPKEPRFFEAEFERGLSYYADTYFSHWNGEPEVGDACNRNLFVPFVPERIHRTVPDAKFVISLRDPVERAYSHWWDHYSVGFDSLSFEEAIESNLERIRNGPDFTGEEGKALWEQNINKRYRKQIMLRYYVDAGYYSRQLRRYFDRFDRDKFHIVFLDALKDDVLEVIERIYRFLDVRAGEEVLSNLDDRPRHVRLGNVGALLGTTAQKLGLSDVTPEPVKEWVRHNLKKLGDQRPPMPEEVEDTLRSHYEPYNRELMELLPDCRQNVKPWLPE